MIRAIIIDDEESGRVTLKYLLDTYFQNKISVLEMAESVKRGSELIRKLKPDLVFLDMELPGEKGLSLGENVDLNEIAVIVTTAHRQYGIDSIKMGVLDYLLKPIDPDDLANSIEKAEKKIAEWNSNRLFRSIITNEKVNPISKVPLYVSSGKTVFVDPNQVIMIQADGNYSTIFIATGIEYLVTRQLKEFEEIFNYQNFFRAHKSYLVNLNYVTGYNKTDEVIELQNSKSVPLSRNVKQDFLDRMNHGR